MDASHAVTLERNSPMRRYQLLLVLAVICMTGLVRIANAGETRTDLRFEITAANDLIDKAQDGRLFVVIAGPNDSNPRGHIGQTGKNTPPYLGLDVKEFSAKSKVVVDDKAAIFPIAHLAKLQPGKYKLQAVFHSNRDLNIPDAPGNLYSDPIIAELDPQKGGPVSLVLSKKMPPDEPPADTQYVKYVKMRSELLSKFHGRPMYLRAAVILPRDFDKSPDARYPLWLRIGGYGTRYTEAGGMMRDRFPFRKLWLDDNTPQLILLLLDGARPYGDPY